MTDFPLSTRFEASDHALPISDIEFLSLSFSHDGCPLHKWIYGYTSSSGKPTRAF